MARSTRLSITVSPAMTVALQILAERSGLPLTTQAQVLLRSALDRTIHSAEAQGRMRAPGQMSVKEWRAALSATHEVEMHYTESWLKERARETQESDETDSGATAIAGDE